jgi:hypothetical protein
MKIIFTFGDTVTIDIIQNTYGSYIYIPKKKVTSPIEFFSIKEAILFFSEFLPTKVYDKDEGSLTFIIHIEYQNIGVDFYMSDDVRTKIFWTNHSSENKGLNEFLNLNQKVDDSIDDTIKHFITFVDGKEKDR